MRHSTALRVARLTLLPARAAARALPAGLRARIEDRIFYAIFNLTRVTNDAYRGTSPEPASKAPREESPRDDAPRTDAPIGEEARLRAERSRSE